MPKQAIKTWDQPSTNDFSGFPETEFWQHAFTIEGSVSPRVFANVILVGVISAAVCVCAEILEKYFKISLGLSVGPHELIGAALGLILVLRTNSGYERWWEARKLWGSIVNQSRNLSMTGLSYGPEDPVWRENFVKLVAAFPHVVRLSLRGQKPDERVKRLLSPEAFEQLSKANHMPSLVMLWVCNLLNEACMKYEMDRFAFLQADKERCSLIDHIGACERILKTPLAMAYSIKIRRFIALFLLSLPFVLLHSIERSWLIPFITMLVAYPLLSLDQLGIELQNPFDTRRLSHLPLDEITDMIERNVLAYWEVDRLGQAVPPEDASLQSPFALTSKSDH